jgi:uncharacterized membrane protein
MDFILWATRSVHLFAVVVWFGGLLYQAVVVFQWGSKGVTDQEVQQLKRFIPFVWMSVWTILVTGVMLMMFNPRFQFFHYNDVWSIVLGAKQLVFFVMVILTLGYSRMLARFLDERSSGGPHESLFGDRMVQLARMNVGLAIVAILLASSLE